MENATNTSRPAFDEKLFEAYENGKHRRYNLLFAVNGGAFAVAKLLDEKGTAGVGNLTVDNLALGMLLFTLVMTFDIAAFGVKMREREEPDPKKRSRWGGLFALQGQFVLAAICLLLSGGWFLVGFGTRIVPGTEGNTVQADITKLIEVNERINDKENLGDLQELDKLVASELAFRRRDGTIVERKTFLGKANPGKRTIKIESVHVYGNRAVVICRVDDSGVVTHNVRLLVKGADGEWRVLGWANEPA